VAFRPLFRFEGALKHTFEVDPPAPAFTVGAAVVAPASLHSGAAGFCPLRIA
jgi:hypothetical protein